MARKKKTDAAATTAVDAPASQAVGAEKKAAAAVSLMAPETTTRGGGGTGGGGDTAGKEARDGEKEVAPGAENSSSGEAETTQQQARGQTAEGGSRADMQLLSASQRKNLKKKLRKQEQRQQEAAVLAAVRGDDAAAAALCSGIGGEEGSDQSLLKRSTGKAAAGRVVAAIYAEQEQALRKRLEAVKMKHFTASGSNSRSASNNAAAPGKKDVGRQMATTAGDIEALILDVDAILEQEESLLRKPLRKRVGVEQLQQQVREMEQQIQKLHKEVQRKTAAAAAAQQALQQKANAGGSSSSHAAAAAAAKAEELEAERSRLEESLRYVSHLREQLILTQQLQEFRNFQERMQAFKAECAATLRTLSHPPGGRSAGAAAGSGGYRVSGGGIIGGEVGSGGMTAGGGSSMNGVATTAGYYSSAKEAQWRRRFQELMHASGRGGVDAYCTSAGQAALNSSGDTNNAPVTPPPPPRLNNSKLSAKGNAGVKSASTEKGEEEDASMTDRKQDSAVAGGSSSAAVASLLLQTVNLGADAMSLVFPGAAAGGSSSKLPLVRKIERAHQVVLEKQQGGGGRAGVVLMIGLDTAAVRQCAATLAALDESTQTEKRSKYRIEAPEGCSIGSVIGVRGGNLRKLEEECGVVVWAEGTEFIVIAPTSSAVQKGLQRLKDLMASSQSFAGGDNNNIGAGGGASVTITLPVPVARACLASAMRTKIRDIEAQTNCMIRVLRRGTDGAVLVSAADAAAAAAGGKALQDAAAQLDIRTIPAEGEKVIRLLKNQNNLSFNAAARERSGVACLRGEDGLVLVGPVEGGALDEAQQAAQEALQQLLRVTENVVLTQNQLRVLTRAERTAIEEKTGVHFRMPRVGGGNTNGSAALSQGGGKVAAAVGNAAGGEKGKVVIALVGRVEEVKQARELVEQVLREKGYQEVVEACRELATALLADRGAGVRKLEEKYEVSVSIEKQERRVTIRGPQERVQECVAEVRERHLQMQPSAGTEGGGGVYAAGSGSPGGMEQPHGGSGSEERGASNGIADIVVQRVPIRRSQVPAFIGKRGTHVRGIQAASGVDSIRVEETEGMVIIRGSSHAVAKGVQLVTESLADTAAAAGSQLEQQQQERGGRDTNVETLDDGNTNGAGYRAPSGTPQQQQLNGDALSGSGGRQNAQYSRGRRGAGRGRQSDQGPQDEQQEEYSMSAGKGSNNSSYFNRTGGGRGTRGGRRGGGFTSGGAQNSRHHEQQQQERSPPVAMDASDETAFPSLEDATGAAMFEKKYLGRGHGGGGGGPSGAQQQQGTGSSKQSSKGAPGRNSSSVECEDLASTPAAFEEEKDLDSGEINLRANSKERRRVVAPRDEEAEDKQRSENEDDCGVQQHNEEEYEQHEAREDDLYRPNAPVEKRSGIEEEGYAAEGGSSAVLLFSNNSSEAPTAAAHLNGNCCESSLLRDKDVTIEGAACPVAAAAQHHCVPCTSSVPEEEVF